MDTVPPCPAPTIDSTRDARGQRRDRVALVLQGGGALGAYQGGVFQALEARGIVPDWIAAVSIGAINGAIIAGNPPERRLERLRGFWELITARRMEWPILDGDAAHRIANTVSAAGSILFGQPGFFKPNLPGPWLSPRGSKQATAYYDTSPLRETLLHFVDFDLLNDGPIRFAVSAVNVASGNFAFFDNRSTRILPEHIMASAALPPGFPMVQVGTDYFWDGGTVSNTPLWHVLTTIEGADALVFQVDLFSASGRLPRDIQEVSARQKEIQYSSRTRMVTDAFKSQYTLRSRIRQLLERLPPDQRTEEDRLQLEALRELPEVSILQLIYQQAAYEGDAQDYEFSRRSMNDHWESGRRDTRLTLERKDWLKIPGPETAIVSHDIHRPDE
jgi:NTE family protein